jgi:hypothetical protein
VRKLASTAVRRRVLAAYHVTDPRMDHERMAEWGEVKGTDVFVDETVILSAVLGPDGEPLVYERYPLGFDLTPKGRRE